MAGKLLLDLLNMIELADLSFRAATRAELLTSLKLLKLQSLADHWVWIQ